MTEYQAFSIARDQLDINFNNNNRKFSKKKVIGVMLILATFVFFLNIYASLSSPNIANPRDVIAQQKLKSAKFAATVKRTPPIFNGVKNEQQKAVLAAFQHGWSGYKEFAWGHDELLPVSQNYQDSFDLGLTIVDSLDTAIIMGLEEETREAINWIDECLSFESNRFINLFESTIRVLGGLLSSYHLTGEKILLTKAQLLGDRLLKAFNQSSPLPQSDVNLKTGSSKTPNNNLVSLAEAASLQLEFRDLSRATGDKKYEELSFEVSKHIHNIGCSKYDGLCPYYMKIGSGLFTKSAITMGARADSYYEYLLKQWLQTGKYIDWLLDDFLDAMNATKKHIFKPSKPNDFWIVGEIENDEFHPKMDHLACFLAGTLVLSFSNGLNNEHLEMAEKLGETCHQMYSNPTGLGPEIIYANIDEEGGDDIIIHKRDSHSILRPEAFEAWFYLYRQTGEKKYQDWGWEAFQAIEKYAKVSTGGYSSIKSVLDAENPRKTDKMESFFMAETLKYLYLLLADDQSILPLDRWVFNTEAHPMPIFKN